MAKVITKEQQSLATTSVSSQGLSSHFRPHDLRGKRSSPHLRLFESHATTTVFHTIYSCVKILLVLFYRVSKPMSFSKRRYVLFIVTKAAAAFLYFANIASYDSLWACTQSLCTRGGFRSPSNTLLICYVNNSSLNNSSSQQPSEAYPLPTLLVKSLSRVLLIATPWTVAYQALLCTGFFRQ